MPFSLHDFLTFRGPEGGLAGVVARAKQLAAGMAEGTVANASETPGSYRPAIVDQPAALVGVIKQIASGKGFDNSNVAEQYITNSLRRANLASQRTNETLGVSNPKNTNELALRVIGNLALPGAPRGAKVAEILDKLPLGAKAVSAARATAKVTPKPVKLAAKVAAEVALPARQTSLKTAAATGTVLTAGLDTLLDQTVDPTTGERYQGSVPKMLGVESTPHPHENYVPPDELDQLAMGTAVTLGDAHEDDLKDPIDLLAEHHLTQQDADTHDQDEKLNNYEKAAVAVGAVIGGAAIARYGHQFLGAREAASVLPDNLPQFTGKAYRTSRSGLASKAKTAIVQQDQPIRNMAEEFLGRNYAKQWGYRADRMTNVSIGSRVKHFFHTGELPATGGRSVKLAPTAEAYAKELSPDEQRLVSDALNAASSLDDYRATGVLSSLNRDREGNPVTAKQLSALVDSVKSNPKYAKYFDAVQKSYDDLLKYQVARGRMTHADYVKLREKRPNYVEMNRNLEGDAPFATETHRYSANTDQGLGAARATEEGGGIQGTTGVGNPFVSLFDRWTNEIRRSDLNDLRADFLVNMDARNALNNKGLRIIEQVTPNRTDDDIHRVRVGGRELAFKVRDPEVARALHMSPRASYKTLEGLRQMQQSMTTGPLASVFNLFAATKSPIYDATIANITRPKGMKLGLANRLLVGGYTGALRYMWDDMRGAMATTLRDNMIRENSWLKGLLGDANLDNLATMFENSYENSVKADIDRLGITSATMHGSPDASKLASGVEQVAPHFAQAAEDWIRDDIALAASKGDLSPFKATLATTKSAYASANASRIARIYGSVVEALHNGVRYSAHAANKGNIKNLDEHISAIRRLSADSSQHGGSDLWNKTMGSLMYANLGVQSLYEVARRAKEQPVTFLLNMGTLTGTIAAMHYAALGSDPVAMERHKAKTPQQRSISLTTFGGAEIPLDPVTRLYTSALFPLYDRISGVSDGNFNPNFFKVMESWLEGDAPKVDEATQKEMSIGLWEAVQANNPLSPASFPIANVGAASFGVDPGMSRVTDETTMERTQSLTGLEDDTSRPDSLLSAHMENMLSALFSTTGRSIYQMADDLTRSYGKTSDLNKSTEVALNRWRDNAVKGAGPFRPILFGNYPSVESASDINYQMLKDREPGIKQATDVLSKDVKAGNVVSGLNPFTARFLPQEEGVAPPPEVRGTELGYISSMASQLERQFLKPHRDILAGLGKQVEGYNAQYTTPYTERNVAVNKINEERRYQRLMMLNNTRRYEEIISQRLGRPFTFKDFDPKDYLKPMDQPNQ